MKQDGRGKHGNQGRPATGRKRTKPLSAKFSDEELESIVKTAKIKKMSQADFVLSHPEIKKMKQHGKEEGIL